MSESNMNKDQKKEHKESNPKEGKESKFNLDLGHKIHGEIVVGNEEAKIFSEKLEALKTKSLTPRFTVENLTEFTVKINLSNEALIKFVSSLHTTWDVVHIEKTNRDFEVTVDELIAYFKTLIVSRVRFVQRRWEGGRNLCLSPVFHYKDKRIVYPSEMRIFLPMIGISEDLNYGLRGVPTIEGEVNANKPKDAQPLEGLLNYEEMLVISQKIEKASRFTNFMIARGAPSNTYTLDFFDKVTHTVKEDGSISMESHTPCAGMIEPSMVIFATVLGITGIEQVMPTNTYVYCENTAILGIRILTEKGLYQTTEYSGMS